MARRSSRAAARWSERVDVVVAGDVRKRYLTRGTPLSPDRPDRQRQGQNGETHGSRDRKSVEPCQLRYDHDDFGDEQTPGETDRSQVLRRAHSTVLGDATTHRVPRAAPVRPGERGRDRGEGPERHEPDRLPQGDAVPGDQQRPVEKTTQERDLPDGGADHTSPLAGNQPAERWFRHLTM